MVTLLLALHNHQPIGNLAHVFAAAFRRCYAPVLETFGRHSDVHLALHHSGPLLEWIEAHEASYLRDLEALVAAGQVEILGGGFYEPLLAALPARDARGQVAMMSDYWDRRTGIRPLGFWLTERIWDPSLPATLAGSGLAYTLVDDAHLRYAGLQDARFSGYYLTEKGGDPLALFPIDQQLRYAIPFAPADQVVDQLGALTDGTTLTYGDDGEKFGVWPNTYEWVIEKGWLETFLTRLEGARDRIRTMLPSSYLRAHRPTGRVYLPTASYEEMMEWSLPATAIATYQALRNDLAARGELDRYRPFVRGGTWDNFLVKYPESNQMHKRMLIVSDRLAAAIATGVAGPELEEARRSLYAGQCNCAYWHGLFGGLYVNYLRHGTYAEIIRADRLLDRATGADGVQTNALDYDRDGHDEFVVATSDLTAIVKPDAGGALVELDWKPADFNVLNTLARKREAYHANLLDPQAPADHTHPEPVDGTGIASIHNLPRDVSPELLRALVVDRVLRHSFVDHLWRPDTTLQRLERSEDTDLAPLAGEMYTVRAARAGAGSWSADLERRVTLPHGAVAVVKRYEIPSGDGGVAVSYTIHHAGPTPTSYWFAVEFNIALLAGDAPDRYFEFEAADGTRPAAGDIQDRRLGSRGAVGRLRAVRLVDEYSRIAVRIAARTPFELWRFPVETVSQSESGYERAYQESALFCHWRHTLTADEPLGLVVTLTVSSLR